MIDSERGVTAIFTGEGKGKTSAALGFAARFLGQGHRLIVIQFIKGRKRSGEQHLADRLEPEFTIERVGKGFTWLEDFTHEEHRAAAQEGLKRAGGIILEGKHKVVALDEILYALKANLVDIQQVETLIDMKPAHVNLILTGRGAPDRLIEKADLVTIMEPVKHPKQVGIPAQKCVDY